MEGGGRDGGRTPAGRIVSALLASVGATVGAAAVLALAAALVRVLRKLAAIEDVVCGRPANVWLGDAEVPGIASRMRVVEERTRTLEGNGGSTLADAVRRTETKVDVLAVRMDDHVRNHPGPGGP